MQITLFVADLVCPPGEGDAVPLPELPALSALLARGTRRRRSACAAEAALGELLGQPRASAAALARAAGEETPLAGDAALLCSDPVHLRLHDEHLVLADSANFAISRDEADAFVAALNVELADAGRFEAASADRWYLRLADPVLAAELATPPLSMVAGRRIEHLLGVGASGRRLRALLNAAQVALHAHPANAERERRGEPTINGVWLWGGGSAPVRVDSRFDGVWGGDALARGLARHAGVPAYARPADAAALLAHAARATEHLVIVDTLAAPAHYENAETFGQALRELEAQWFAPLHAALARGGVDALRVVAPTVYGLLDWQIRRADRWKFWRTPQRLGALADELAQA